MTGVPCNCQLHIHRLQLHLSEARTNDGIQKLCCFMAHCVCLRRNFQLLSFGEEAEEDEREVTEVVQVYSSAVLKTNVKMLVRLCVN